MAELTPQQAEQATNSVLEELDDIIGDTGVLTGSERDATDPAPDTSYPRMKYPLTISGNFPNRIIFRAIKVDGIDIAQEIKDAAVENPATTGFLLGGGVGAAAGAFLGGGGNRLRGALAGGLIGGLIATLTGSSASEEAGNASVADKETTLEDKATLATQDNKDPRFYSYENRVQGEPVGQVTLPLPRDLRYADIAQYGTANLGAFGGGVEGFAREGTSVLEGDKLSTDVGNLAIQKIASVAGEGLGAALGAKLAGGTGGLIGASALGGLDQGLQAGLKSATRITTAPNQRTMFEQVQLRNFAFTFKMVANSRDEAKEIRNIVKFFRTELYPELIPFGRVPLGYRFPNMFEIEVKNRYGDDAAFKIQRCYLRDVQTTFNSASAGMYRDGQFVEVDVSLQFQEITALHKGLVEDGF